MFELENYTYSDEELRVVRVLFDPTNKLSVEQVKLFLHVAKDRKLDPRLKQICAIPKHNKNTGKVECVIVTQIDGFRLIAERTGKYAPGDDTEFLYDKNGGLLGAKVFVKKMTNDGTWHQVSATAFIKEYNAGTFPWKNMPHVMIEKCAEARALRRAFPAELSGLYSTEEMDQSLDETEKDLTVSAVDVEVTQVKERISEDQLKVLTEKLKGKNDIKKKILDHENVSDLKDVSLEFFYKIIKRLNALNEANAA